MPHRTTSKRASSSQHSTEGLGGRRAIAGFLFQILRSLHLGLSGTAALRTSPDGALAMRLVLEPTNGGDHRLDTDVTATVEQVKMRSPGRRWSSGEVARGVFPDLIAAADPERPQRFRFVTDNARGLEELRSFLVQWQGGLEVEERVKFRWGHRRLTKEEYAGSLAEEAGVTVDNPNFLKLLAALELHIVDGVAAQAEVDRIMEPFLLPGQAVTNKREELIGRLLKAAADGRVLSHQDLLGMVHPEAHLRIAHVQSLSAMLKERVGADCRSLGYDPAKQARLESLLPCQPITIFSGHSGQGKTWSMCHSAVALAETGAAVVVMRAPATIERIADAINDRVWVPAYQASVPISVMAQRLRRALQGVDGVWLTVFIDDVQDRALAEELGQLDWDRHGVRLVVSAQPRLTQVIARDRSEVQVEAVGNFTSAELRRFLNIHGRDDVLETMPDDVLELLLKPIHARTFVGLPGTGAWSGATEYALFKSYWTFAAREHRSQYDHPSDREGLLALAGSLLRACPRYPLRCI
jgi:hypothetical protein